MEGVLGYLGVGTDVSGARVDPDAIGVGNAVIPTLTMDQGCDWKFSWEGFWVLCSGVAGVLVSVSVRLFGRRLREGIDLLFLVAGRFLGKGLVVVVVNPGGLGLDQRTAFSSNCPLRVWSLGC